MPPLDAVQMFGAIVFVVFCVVVVGPQLFAKRRASYHPPRVSREGVVNNQGHFVAVDTDGDSGGNCVVSRPTRQGEGHTAAPAYQPAPVEMPMLTPVEGTIFDRSIKRR